MLPETSEKLDKILLPKAFHADFFFFPIYMVNPNSYKRSLIK